MNRNHAIIAAASVLGILSIVNILAALSTITLSRQLNQAVDEVPHILEPNHSTLACNISGSIHENTRLSNDKVPTFQIDDIYQDEQRRIDQENASTRCDRYNLKPYDGPPRRIFFGTMIADDNWEVFVMHAIEVFGIYHVAAFVESNTTHMAVPRELRFKDSEEGDLLLQSGMFGPKTQVSLDLWLEDMPDLKWMNRESEQRNTIIKRWKDAGMLPEDVGIMSDIDEVFSRDFLRAVQTCDFPELQPDSSCHRPKIVPAALSFEISPFCINKKPWFHPDIIAGQCVDGIGDPTERVTPLRNHQRRYGERHKSYGMRDLNNYPEAVHKSGRYPLFTGPDIRTVHGDRGYPYNFKDLTGDMITAAYGVAYHFHNWFLDGQVLRYKYLTYAHSDSDVERKTLSQIGGEVDAAVRCAKGFDNEANPYNWALAYYPDGRSITGPRPIFFLNETYLEERHKLLQEIVRLDEAKYGSSYDSNGTWIEHSLLSEAKRREAIATRSDSLRTKVTAGNASETNNQTRKKDVVTSSVKYPETPFRDSSTATVMGMATGVNQVDLSRFIDSLRNTGYRGHIILGVNANVDMSLLAYMKRQGVTPKLITYSNCTFEPFYKTEEDIKAEGYVKNVIGLSVCIEPYLDIKSRWAKFPMGRDWLQECSKCTGPVLISDVRDVFFQRDPFGPGTPEVTGLQVYEEHPASTTEHWLVDWPVGECKGVHLKKPMLCSGTTIGTRDAMMSYLDTMYGEMKRWINDPKCRFKTLGDDQSIHNWLFYNGDLKDAVAVKHREGVVNTVGYEGSKIFVDNEKRFKEKGVENPHDQPLHGATDRTWISSREFGLTNEDGEFTNLDGTISPVVHQYDRFGPTFNSWMRSKGLFSG